jgi:arsenate reductase-like glutaredoxin family protein
VPAPLGRTPTKKMPKIQVFGIEDSQATRAALRFFRERRIVATFVDLRKRPIAPAELRRFVDRLGASALVAVESGAHQEGGTAPVATDTAGLAARIRSDPRLLRLPLVRYGDEVTAGRDETTWSAWLARPK